MKLINMCYLLKYVPQWIIWMAAIFCDRTSYGLTCNAYFNQKTSTEEFLNRERTKTSMESQANLEEPKLVLEVLVNNRRTDNETIYFDVGDKLRFSCNVLHKPIDAVYRYKIIHDKFHNVIPEQGTIRKFNFNIIGSSLDNASHIYCTAEGEKINKLQSAIKNLIMNSGTSKSDCNVIEYTEGQSKFSCTSSGSHEGKEILSTDSNLFYFCTIIHEINETGKEATYTREIYNKTLYHFNTNNASELSNTSIIGIGLGVTACIVLVGVVCLLYVVRKRQAELQPPRDSVSNQVIYADLELSERPSRTILVQENNDTPYAQVIGIVQKKK